MVNNPYPTIRLEDLTKTLLGPSLAEAIEAIEVIEVEDNDKDHAARDKLGQITKAAFTLGILGIFGLACFILPLDRLREILPFLTAILGWVAGALFPPPIKFGR